MVAQASPDRFVRFGPFEVDLRERELRKQGQKVKLQEQPFRVLTALLECPGRTVTSRELSQRIWPSGTFVNFEQSLAAAVLKIRRALGDSTERPLFIETIPRHGYRFIAEVQLSDETRSQRESSLVRFARPGRRWPWTVGLLTAALLVIASAALWFMIRVTPGASNPTRIIPLTSSGSESIDGFSPDGSQVLLGWCDPNNPTPDGNCDLYVRLLGAEGALRLTTSPFLDLSGAWSPDGRWIAFVRRPPTGKAGYHLIPPFGGKERKLLETSIPIPPDLLGNLISWFPDAERLVVTVQDSPGDPLSLFLLSVRGDEQWDLTSPPPGSYGDSGPAVSPDGSRIIFNRTQRRWEGDLFLLELTKDLRPRGTPIQLTFDGSAKEGLAWTPDGHEIIFNGGGRLWRMRISGRRPGRVEALPFDPGRVGGPPAISGDGRHLAYTVTTSVQDILRVELSDPMTAVGTPAAFLSSTRIDALPEYSPDGRGVAFVTNRLGSFEIWTCGSDGSKLSRVLSDYRWSPERGLRWSPDGKWIAFTTNSEDGNRDVAVVPAEGGVPRRLTTEPSEDFSACWSADGSWIYFSSDRGGEPGIWKMPARGGEPVLVATGVASDLSESGDEGALYYLRPAAPGRSDYHSLWRLDLKSSESESLLDSVRPSSYAVADTGIYFISRHHIDCRCNHLQYLEFASGQIKTVLGIKNPSWGLSISPDGHSLLYTRHTFLARDAILVENFRSR